jgi:mRNA-degrading endonuclease RelE of RelBE toxin-antitoxin system
MRRFLSIFATLITFFAFSYPQEYYIKKIEEQRREKDKRFATSEVSPLSPVAHFHFDIGSPLKISISESEVKEGEFEDAPHILKFSWEGKNLFLEALKGEEEIKIDGASVKGKTEIKEGKRIKVCHYVLVYTIQTESIARIMVYDVNSPAKKNFKGLNYFPVNPAYRVKAKLIKNPNMEKVKILTYQNILKTFVRYGFLEFEINGVKCRLTAFKMPDQIDSKELFVPFKDKTSGNETYSAGRFLDVEEEGDECIIDFNLAYNPLCSYNPHWNCPLPPKENELNVRIEAGEKVYLKED